MKQIIARSVFALVLGAAVAAAQRPPDWTGALRARGGEAAATITAGELKEHVGTLASDAFAGRLTGTPAHLRTVEYVEARFRELGLKPMGDPGEDGTRSYRQAYGVVLTEAGPASGLRTAGGDAFATDGAWIAKRFAPAAAEGRLVFVADAHRELELENLDGAIPVVALRNRFGDDEATVMTAIAQGMQLMGPLRSVSKRLQAAGAAAAVVLIEETSPGWAVIANTFGIFPGHPAVQFAGGGRGMLDQAAMLRLSGPVIPTFFVAGEAGKPVLEALGLEAEEAFGPESRRHLGRRSRSAFSLRLEVEAKETEAYNVAALLEGGERAGECIVYSAHNDHVGLAPGGVVFNGADDNASGTATLLEIAEAWAAVPEAARPARSILFLSVSGEELGLWGSAHFVDSQAWPVERIAANINVDMIGRNTPKVPADTISITPTYRHREYNTLARDAFLLARAEGLNLTSGDRFYERSDHYNFARKKVPVVFLCDDEHEDYHLPTDDADRIEYAKVERLGRLLFLLGLHAADAPRPERIGRVAEWLAEPDPAAEEGKDEEDR